MNHHDDGSAGHPPGVGARSAVLVREQRAAQQPLTLDAYQRRVLDRPPGPQLVLAGPGTGKTATMVELVAARIEAGLSPDHVLVLTFSRKAAAELRARIAARLPRPVREPVARTIHSYAYALLRREAAAQGRPLPRIMTAAEQDAQIRDLLAGHLLGEGTTVWPPELGAAPGLPSFAQELRDLLSRVTERGIVPRHLRQLARLHGRAEWRASADFVHEYWATLDVRQERPDEPRLYDISGVVAAATALLRGDRGLLARERDARRLIVVDEYQDTDPGQEALLRTLAGDHVDGDRAGSVRVDAGREVVVVGDPDQSIYAFRGAEVACLERFPDVFLDATGARVDPLPLRTCRRSGAGLVAASRRVALRLGGPDLHRRLDIVPGAPPGELEVVVSASAVDEAELVADLLRREHLQGGTPWHRMAVLLRSTRVGLPVIRRSLIRAGVPFAVAVHEVPLGDHPAVDPLLAAVAAGLSPEGIDETSAVALLSGRIGRADPMRVRRIRRSLREVERAAGGSRSSGDLLVEAITAGVPAGVPVAERRPLDRVRRVLRAVAETGGEPGATLEEVLWAAWSAAELQERLVAASADGGPAGATADADLDAVVALFDAAARLADARPGAGPADLVAALRDQQVPADTLAPSAERGDVVQVMTAHASKGLEFDVVVVAGVQDGTWPDVRVRDGVLRSAELLDRILAPDHPEAERLAAQQAALLNEERRLFYVAVTRARRRLVVTAVRGEGDGGRPSRFLDELDPPQDATGDGGRPVAIPTRRLTLPALTAELRSVLTDPAADPDERQAAARRLARLAAEGVPGADPDDWYGLAPWSGEGLPMVEPDAVVRISPSQIEQMQRCSLRWLLDRTGGRGGTAAHLQFGTAVHALAEEMARRLGEQGRVPGPTEIEDEVRRALRGVDSPAPWAARADEARLRQAVANVRAWLNEVAGVWRATEVPVQVRLDDLVGRPAELVGRADQVLADDTGRAVVVDVKTGKAPPTGADRAEAAKHPQLAAYQVAASLGAFEHLDLRGAGGARLVFVATKDPNAIEPTWQDTFAAVEQAPLDPAALSGPEAGAGLAAPVPAGSTASAHRPEPGSRSAEPGESSSTAGDAERPGAAEPAGEAEDGPDGDGPDGDGPDWALQLLVRAVAVASGHAVTARLNDLCDRCEVRAACPLQVEGKQVTA